MADDKASAARLADRGENWEALDLLHTLAPLCADSWRNGLHDRDRYHREAEYWRSECIKLIGGRWREILPRLQALQEEMACSRFMRKAAWVRLCLWESAITLHRRR